MQELLEVVAHAVTDAGTAVSTHVGPFPPDDGDSVYVVVPHEYFVLTAQSAHPTQAQMKRTIALCVEHPGNATFETGARWAAQVGAALDINRDSTEELNRRGVSAGRFVLGYSTHWDQWHGDVMAPRGVDITYLGTTDARRDCLLALQADILSEWRTALFIPPHEQMTRPRPDFFMGAAKHRHLANSRILINLHRGASRSLEWVRVLEAMCNGCVVVSERSSDFEPLVPGTHLVFADGVAVADAASALLRHPGRLDDMRDSAYSECREELSMRSSADRLIEEAQRLASNRRPGGAAAAPSHGNRLDEAPTMVEPQPPDPALPRLSVWAEAFPVRIRQVVSELIAKSLSSLKIEVSEVPLQGSGDMASVDVVIAGNGNPADLAWTLQSLAAQDFSTTVLVARAASAPPEIGHPRGRMLNTLFARTKGAAVLIVDPGQELLPGAVRKLVAAIGADPAISVAYPMVADPRSGGLWNSLPPELARLQRRVYLGAPMMIRREAMEAIGGYAEEPALLGFEDHDLWLRLLSRGHAAILVPEILARGSRTTPPLASISGLTPEVTASLLNRNPETPTRR